MCPVPERPEQREHPAGLDPSREKYSASKHIDYAFRKFTLEDCLTSFQTANKNLRF